MWLGKEYKLCLQDKNEEVYNALNEHYSELYSAELIRDWPIFIEFRRTEFYNKFVEEHAEDFETTIIKITDNSFEMQDEQILFNNMQCYCGIYN